MVDAIANAPHVERISITVSGKLRIAISPLLSTSLARTAVACYFPLIMTATTPLNL